MSKDANKVVKKFLTKITKQLLTKEKYSPIVKFEVFFVFGSKTKTAMCDWVYGLKITTTLNQLQRTELIKELQLDIKKQFERFANQSVCCTDVIFN